MNQEEAKIFAAELRVDVPTLDLHGLSIKNALEKFEFFLYDQIQEKNDVIKIIYGGGTGALQKSTLQCLHKHPLVDTIREQGGSCIVLLTTRV